jgi:hypothetical protein
MASVAELGIIRSAGAQTANHAVEISRRAAPSRLSTEATTIKIADKAARVALWNRLSELFGSHGPQVVKDIYDVEKERLTIATSQAKDTSKPKDSLEDQVKMWHNAGMPSPKK